MHMQHMAKVVKTNKLLHEELESSRALIDALLLQLKATKKMQNSAETIGINVTKLNADFAIKNLSMLVRQRSPECSPSFYRKNEMSTYWK